jgi:murein DD-endopeptidase MepM/ murein hydrolase activator NlpD
MLRKQYSLIIADRENGKTHRFSFGVAPVCGILALLLGLPAGFLIYAEWDTSVALGNLRLENAQLELENSGYRTLANDLPTHLTNLDETMAKLVERVDMAPAIIRSMSQLPDEIQVGSPKSLLDAESQLNSLDRLRGLLGSIDDQLTLVRRGVAYREALASATPVIWPADGWISAVYGYRTDPFTGERTFHPAVDISTRRGQPVYATAAGRVFSAGRNGNYGNLIEIDHGFGLITRYGHLSAFETDLGDTVQRGDVIGYVGATGRATGHHVHYEIWSNGRTLNPAKLLAENRNVPAN